MSIRALASMVLTVPLLAHALTAEEIANRAKYTDRPSQMIYKAEDEAELLYSADIFKELQRLLAVARARNAANPGNFLTVDDDTYRSTGFASVLEKRAKTKDPASTFYWAASNWNLSASLDAIHKGQSDQVRTCWLETMEAFKIASLTIPNASFNVARMYENGFGVTPSKFVAADWYVKAAEQNIRLSQRDDALTAIEAALNAVPDHPAGLRLKKTLLK